MLEPSLGQTIHSHLISWMRYQRVSLVPLKSNMNGFLRAAACCVNPSVFLICLSDCSFTGTISLSPVCRFLTTCERSVIRRQPTSSLGDSVRPLMSENSNSCSHKSLRPTELVSPLPHGKRSSLSIVHIYVLFKPLQSFAWSSLIYLVGKKSISVRNAGEIWDVRELWEQGRVAAETGVEIERGSKWGIGEGDEEKWSETVRGANERRCAAGEKRKWILYLSHCGRGKRGRESVSLHTALSI